MAVETAAKIVIAAMEPLVWSMADLKYRTAVLSPGGLSMFRTWNSERTASGNLSMCSPYGTPPR